MPDDLSILDTLAPALQSQLDKTLASGENVLMALAGATGEALAVTDRRVIILREQMPIVGSDTQVDSFFYSYEQIQTATVESATGGGYLKLGLFAPPTDEQHVTLYFPSYDQAKFEVAAARIRLLVEPSRVAGHPGAAPVDGLQQAGQVCRRCGAAAGERDVFCQQCGAALAKACGFCNSVLPAAAVFCPVCGSPASLGRDLTCPACQHTLAPNQIFCPACGHRQVGICEQCGLPAPSAWTHCIQCGHSLGAIANTVSAQPVPAASVRGAPSAQEHNERGMRLYEQEQYEAAVREFEAALDIAPGTPLYHCNLGVAYAEMGRDEEALEEYQVAVRLAPNDPSAYLNLGYFYAARDNTDEAKRWWNKAVEVAPDSAEAQEARQNLQHADEL